MSSEQHDREISGEDVDDSENQDDRRADRDPDAISLGDSGGFDDEDDFGDAGPETTEINTGSESAETASEEGQQSGVSTQGKESSQSVSTYAGEIPHRVRADSPRDERIGLNVHVAQEDKHRLQELEQLADQEFDEKVFTIDVYLAALRGGLHDETEFLDEMREIGYGWINRQNT